MEYSSGDTTLAVTPYTEAEAKEDESPSAKDLSCEDESEPEPTATKKRTWRKPKDKPKRPLSAYNLFFQHSRARVVAGTNHELSRDEVIQSIESILSKSQPKRRHRKTHGKISFGDLARTIAQEWKSIHPKIKEVFDHYAEVDMVRYRRELKVWKEKKEQESEATAMEKFKSFSSQLSSSSASDQFSLDELHDETNSSDAASLRDSTHSSQSSSGEFKSSERRRMKSESMNDRIPRQQQQQQFSHLGQQNQENAFSMNAEVHDLQGNMGGSHTYQNSLSFVPTNYCDEEAARTQWLQQLKVQHAMQMNHMQLLQMRQFQLQQHLEAHRNGMHSSGGMVNRNVMSMGHSTFSGQGHNPSSMTQLQNHLPHQGSSSAYNTSIDEGVNHHQAIQGQSPFVSDYSSSNSFVENSFVPIHQSSGLMNGSPSENHQRNLSSHVHPLSQNFTGQDFTNPQINVGDSNFGFSGGHNNADFSSNDESNIAQQGLRGMDMGLGE